MSLCEKEIKKLMRSDCIAGHRAGFRPYILFALMNDVSAWCTFGDETAITYSALEKKVLTKGNITLKEGKFWQRVEVLDQGKIKLTTKKAGNAWKTEAKARLQNSMETRGWLTDAQGSRLIALVFESDETNPILLGHKDGYYAELKKDGGDVEFGEMFDDDKYADITLEYMPNMPFNYTGTYPEVAVV